MSDRSETSARAISTDTSTVHSSLELVVGSTLSDSPVGVQLDLFGPSVVPVLPSPQPARKKPARRAVERALSRALDELASSCAPAASMPGMPMSGISGPRYGGSFGTVSLQQSLVSKLVVMMEEFGSPEFELRWSYSATPLGLPILQRGASARRTSDSDSSGAPSGWPTPTAEPANGEPEAFLERKRKAVANGSSMGITLSDLQMVAKLAGAPRLAGWATPRARDEAEDAPNLQGGARLSSMAALSGCPTPTVQDAGHLTLSPAQQVRNPNVLSNQAHLAGWGTPSARDHKDAGPAFEANPSIVPVESRLASQATLANDSGTTTQSSPVGTGSSDASAGVLNAEFSLWLMGFPPEWMECGLRAISSIRSRKAAKGEPLS